jgi:DNA-binding response OmpR family regulator
MHVDHVRLRIEMIVPDIFEQHGSRHHLPRVFHQIFEQTNVIDVHISRLRSKIDKGRATPLLRTIRGAGYMIRENGR